MELREILQKNGFFNILSVEKIKSFSGRVYRFTNKHRDIFYLKKKESVQQIMREVSLGSYLNENHIRTPCPIKLKSGNYFFQHEEALYCVYEAVSCHSLNDNGLSKSPEFFYFVGESIGNLHNILQRYNSDNYIQLYNLVEEIETKCLPVMRDMDNDLFSLLQKEILSDYDYLKNTYSSLPVQLIHGDLHENNLIYQNSEIAGFFDFDQSVKCLRLFDICYYSLCELSSCLAQECENGWLDILRFVIRGYNKEAGLQTIEKKCFYSVLISIELLSLSFAIGVKNMEAIEKSVKTLVWLLQNSDSIKGAIIDSE